MCIALGDILHWVPPTFFEQKLLPPAKRSLQRLCFYRCLSFCPWLGVYLSACWDTPYPRSRHAPGADPPRSRPSPRSRPAQEQAAPSKADTPRVSCMVGYTANKHAVRILLECILVHKNVFVRRGTLYCPQRSCGGSMEHERFTPSLYFSFSCSFRQILYQFYVSTLSGKSWIRHWQGYYHTFSKCHWAKEW